MKVGDYVRFDYHRVSTPIQIAKITETHYDIEDDSICYSTDCGLVIDENNLVKEPSQNIIDLIEVGDYVNGYLIAKIYDVFETSPNKLKEAHIKYADENFISQLYDTDIKSIVTKEQFESMEYKIN